MRGRSTLPRRSENRESWRSPALDVRGWTWHEHGEVPEEDGPGAPPGWEGSQHSWGGTA